MKTPSDKKAYCFPLNASDWLASPSVKLMSKAERGVYIMLLCTAWENKATLPASEDKVRRLAEMSVDEWKESHEVLLEKFPLSECQTYRFNPRLMAEYEVQEGRRKGASLAGLKSAEARAAKEAAEAALQRNGNGMATTVAENPTTVEENANGTPTIREGKVSKVEEDKSSSSSLRSARTPKEPEHFAAFWQAYPRKESRAAALKAFEKLSQLEQAAAPRAALEWFGRRADWIGPNGQDFRPHAATWLNQKRWTDLTEITIIPFTPNGRQQPDPQRNAINHNFVNDEKRAAAFTILDELGL